MKFLEKMKQNNFVNKVNKLDEKYSHMSDDELKRESLRLMNLAKSGESLSKLEAEAFAVAREASWRVLRKKHYDVQVIGGHVLHQGNIAEMSTGSGKAIPLYEKLPTPDGFKYAKDIKVGDYLLSRQGKPTEVKGVFPQGFMDTYILKLIDGRSVRCADSHLWSVFKKNKETGELDYVDLTTSEILDLWDTHTFSLPVNEPVVYPKANFEVEPYQFGRDLIRERSEFSELPEERQFGSLSQRRKMLQGMFIQSIKMYPPLDNRKYTPKIMTFSEELAKSIIKVINSLGLSAVMKTTNTGKSKRTRYLVSINERPPVIYTFLGEKIAKLCDFTINEDADLTPRVSIGIKLIEKLKHQTEQVCFTVDNDEHLFLVGSYVVTHNTLTEVLPAYLNALSGKGVHIITVNDYLAKRDMEEMGKIFKFLGLTVSWINGKMSPDQKRFAYQHDIVYGTNNEFGFDYLRDNMVADAKQRVQRELNYCIIDEVDSIMIDEARTPLIISSTGKESTALYTQVDAIVKRLERGEDEKEMTKLEKISSEASLTEEDIAKRKDFQINERYSTITLTDRGIEKIEKQLGITSLGDTSNSIIYHHVLQAIRANHLMKKNVDYIVKDGEVIIVDASTGRTMEGRRFSDGLHQALEAKEGVEIKAENITSATITLQNYFRLYDKISGMTGTAKTEEQEFKDIYGMKVIQVPNHKPCIREDKTDVIYGSLADKEKAIYLMAKEARAKGRPVLIGTASIEASESLSRYFKSKHLKHELLNAKTTFNQSISEATKEALIIAQAGRSGKITIATNMAGRGTDILLGGNPEHLAVKRMLDAGYDEETILLAQNFVDSDDEEILKLQEKYRHFLKMESELCEKDRQLVMEAGGLMVIGTEKHDSRRIDNQLRGRAGRQGDPGSSQFLISLDDRLFRLYGGSAVSKFAEKAQDTNGEPLYTGGIVVSAVERSQKNIESQNFQQRKDTLEFDEIDSVQREEVYNLRNKILDGLNIDKEFDKFVDLGVEAINNLSDEEIAMDTRFEKIQEELFNSENRENIVRQSVKELLNSLSMLHIEGFTLEQIKAHSLIMALDRNWQYHIVTLQNLKDSVRLSGISQVQPIENYKNEASEAFYEFKYDVGRELICVLLSLKLIVD